MTFLISGELILVSRNETKSEIILNVLKKTILIIITIWFVSPQETT